jgi:uncharacterized membrane protein
MSNNFQAFTISFLIVIIYYLDMMRRTRRAPETSVHAINAKVREQWVTMIINSGKMDILAIQTLRNSVMAANFMASTAVLMIIGTLNLSEKIGGWALNHPYILSTENVSDGLWQIKLGVLLLVFFVAFYCFSMAIRFFNHVGYLINLPNNEDSPAILIRRTCTYLNRAGSYYAVGTRAFYFTLPVVMWFLGPCFLIGTTFGLIVTLAVLDRMPN